MASTRDWLGPDRNSIIEMARKWVSLMTTNYTRWKIPQNVVTELGLLTTAAGEALEIAKNEATRTPVATARCKAAFAELTAAMRDLKRKYLYVPPLTEADIIALGLKPKDTTYSHVPAPTSQTTLETYLAGRHELGIRIIYLTGSPGEHSNKGYRIYYNVVAPGGAVPASPDDLTKSFYTQRLKDVMQFDYADSGKTAWMAVQVEHDGKKGPWGPLVSALIP